MSSYFLLCVFSFPSSLRAAGWKSFCEGERVRRRCLHSGLKGRGHPSSFSFHHLCLAPRVLQQQWIPIFPLPKWVPTSLPAKPRFGLRWFEWGRKHGVNAVLKDSFGSRDAVYGGQAIISSLIDTHIQISTKTKKPTNYWQKLESLNTCFKTKGT